ncbi:Outer membrane protein assembly factor, partial [Candidatus Methanophagaceae archaeon]
TFINGTFTHIGEPKPDLAISEKFETLDDGSFNVTYNVTNIGDADAGQSTTCIYVDGEQVTTEPASELAAGEREQKTVGPFDCPCGQTVNITVCADNADVVDESDETNNCMENELECPPCDLPDLVITQKYESWVSMENRTYNITYTVANIGGADANTSTTSIKVDGLEFTTDSVPELDAGANYTNTLGPVTMSEGSDTIEVCADKDNVIEESNETNNCLENLFEGLGLPDLIIASVALKTPGYVNEDNTLGVRVKNIGFGAAGSFDVALSVDGASLGEQTVSSLAANETTELAYIWTPTPTGEYALSATADVNSEVEESNETNNDLARTSVIIKRTDWPQFHYDEVNIGFSPSGAPDTNETLWISDDIGAVAGSSTVVAEGKVFIYSNGALKAVDEFSGDALWSVPIPSSGLGSWHSPSYHDGCVFITAGTNVYCRYAADGSEKWTWAIPSGHESCNSGTTVANGKVVVPDWDGKHYYCIDEETTELLWTFTETNTGSWDTAYAQGTPAYENGKFYLTTWVYPGGHVYCVDADTGVELWNQITPLDTCGSPAVADGIVYVTNYNFYGDGKIYAMDADTGDLLWNKTIQRTDSTPAVAYGNVYVCGGCSGYSPMQTYCFDAITGDPIWSTDTGDEIGGWTCSVAVADEKVFVGHPGSFFDYAGTYALDAFTGDVIWSYPEGGSSPAVADDIVFTIGGGRVYAFYTESGPDLTVTAIETPARLRADVVNPITAAVENLGSADATSFDVTLEADGTVVDTVSIAALNASENTTVELLWTPTVTGNCTLNVTADANGAIEENDETNNSLTEDVTVLEKLTATVNVRIEGQNDTVWTGTVTFSNSTVTTTDGATHYLNEPTALGALDEADKIAGFGYVLVDYSWGLYVEEVADEPAIGWDGWMYRVDYTSPWVGADVYTLYGGENVLWYFGAWTASPLKIELETTVVNVSEDFIATVTAYNDTSGMNESVDNATVFVDGLTFQTGPDGNATLSIETAGDYSVYADKGTWADYTRSEKKAVTVVSSSVESYGESVYAKKNVLLAWRALGEPDNRGAVLHRKARIAIELEETIPGCKNVSVWVRKLGFWPVQFDVYVSSDGTDWTKIGRETCIFPRWKQYDFSGDFGDVQYIAIKKPGTAQRPKFMGLDAVYAKN